MKKINSIHYGGGVIGIGLVCMLMIPGILLGINTFWDCRYIAIIANIFFVIGAILLAGFGVVLLIEFHQDKRLDIYYSRHKYVKIMLSNGEYECGACGSRTTYADSVYCNICGCKYEDERNKSNTGGKKQCKN